MNELCNDCNGYLVKKLHKQKEERIAKLFKEHNIEVKSSDKIPDFACSKYRPDFVIEKPLFTIIFEVDENQHRSYTCECEQKRMIQLHNDFGGTPLIFIRYNPDNYKDSNDRLVKPNNKVREKAVLELLNSLDNRKEWKIPLSAYYLYYDGHNGINKLYEIKY